METKYYKDYRININKLGLQDDKWFVEWDIMTKIRGGWKTTAEKFSLSVPSSYSEDGAGSIALQNAIKYIDKNL